MTNVAGFNPMRWNCQTSGCFNLKRRPKIEVFADCFPRRINFGDVDGLVEIGGMFCLLEWKGDGGSVRTGQRLSYLAFTREAGNVVFVVNGNAETMAVDGYSTFWGGRQLPLVNADLDALKARIRWWAEWVQRRPVQFDRVADRVPA